MSSGTLAALMTSLFIRGCAAVDQGEETRGAGESAALEGSFRSYVVDYENGEHRVGHVLETYDGKRVELEFAAFPTWHDGDLIRITGSHLRRDTVPDGVVTEARVRVDHVELLAEGGLGRTDQAVVDGSTTTVKVAVILLDFEGVAAQRFTQDDARNRLTEVKNYYQEISYGTWNVEAEYFGPFTVPKPPDCDLGRIGDIARTTMDTSGFDHVAVTLPGNDQSGFDCACGVAWLGRTPAQGGGVQQTSYYTCTDSNAFAHELGHAFGLHHASTAKCSGVPMKRNVHDNCQIDEYGNSFNTMGNGLGHMNAFQKAGMKWLDRCNTLKVASDGEFDLTPIQLESDAPQALQIPYGDTREGNPLFYYVEYRNPGLANFNAKDGGNNREKGIGVHIDVGQDYAAGSGDGRPILLDLTPGSSGSFSDPRLQSGQSFRDPDGRVTIEVLATEGERARVKVTFPNGGGGANVCSDGSNIPGEGGNDNPAGATLFQDCDFGGWAVSLREGDYDTAALLALGVRDNDASSVRVNEGYEVVAYDGPDFTGNELALPTTSACFVAQTFNDVLSSLRVRKVGTGGDGDGDGGSEGDGSAQPGDGEDDPPPVDGDDEGDGEGDGADSGDGDGTPGGVDVDTGCSLSRGADGNILLSFTLLHVTFALARRAQRRKTRV